jgi:hypothetical protein
MRNGRLCEAGWEARDEGARCVACPPGKVIFFENTTTTLGTPNLWPLLTGGRCSVVGLCYKDLHRESDMVVAVGRWPLAQV